MQTRTVPDSVGNFISVLRGRKQNILAYECCKLVFVYGGDDVWGGSEAPSPVCSKRPEDKTLSK